VRERKDRIAMERDNFISFGIHVVFGKIPLGKL
jgi:hypothetical protein